MRLSYKNAVDEWVATIRAEEALATPDHSMIAMEKWDAAHFTEHDGDRQAPGLRSSLLLGGGPYVHEGPIWL